MFNLSLSRSFSGWIRPSRTPNGLSIDDTATGVFAAELLDRITDHLHDDRPTLLRLGITCRQTLIRSRLLLFAKLEFTKGDEKQFDMFLALLEAPWTSFTNAVESLHLQEMFYTSHIFLPKKNLPRILAHLPNLQTIRLSRIIWARIPSHIRDFTSQINITDLVLESVAFPTYQTGKNNIVELFSGLQPSLKSITLYNLQFDDNFIPDLSQHSSIFRRRIHLKLLDTTSLLLLKDVWDPLRAKDLDITVDSFHVRLVHMTRSNVEAYTAFFSRFLRQVGPSLHHVFIKLTEQYLGIHALPYYEAIDLSQCINVRIVQCGTFELDHISRSGQRMLPMISTMWKSLSTLPPHSPSLEQIVLIVRPFGKIPDGIAAELESFSWLDIVGKSQEMFPNLKTFTVGVGYYQGAEDSRPYLAALRRAPGMRQLEENGTVVLHAIPWESYALPDPVWK